MKTSLLKLAVLGALGFMSNAYAAPGLVALPTTGFSTSAYTNCFNDGRTAGDPKGNFGMYSPITVPTASVNNTCWVAKPASELVSPISGYSLVGSRSVSIPRATGDTSVLIGTLLDYAWRNSTTNMCIIGTRVTMNSNDHDNVTAGTQSFEINDIARSGFTGLAVNAGYTLFSATASPVYRQGRTFTSVQHRALKYDNSTNASVNGTNYLDLPTKISVTANISGENTPIDATTTASTTLATQDAVVNDKWVDFTLDVGYLDDDGASNAVSAFTYIQAPCTANPTVVTNGGAIRLRSTAQEFTNFKEIIMDGYSIGTP